MPWPCPECNILEPLDGHTLHNGMVFCEGCSRACPGAPICQEVSL